ncbi:polysaccharide deacetylase family protein [Pelagovum pacificum]|uniref:Chitooligosaccharide deacetylase n=1 Tax=Pelagovum pacificum TaxID=2588711 RepID=A0A5C5GHE4_9RHOB|nr:polysaccharide deacetylase family protein [Pelagovum pacificum]QQA43552.1 polysaccharide deacetylase family protein [Pelagovum pacificum]TNY33311.1 hypothetical protein FHY64_08580 [Pelagovum pacificum]
MTDDRRTPNRAKQRNRAALGALAAVVATAAVAPFLVPALPAMGAAGLGALAGAAMATPFMIRRRGTPVLTYHSVSPDAAWLPWADQTSIRPETLEAQARLYRRMGYTALQTEEFIRDRRMGRLPKRPLVIHFDDGYLNNRIHAWPILKRHGLTATLFVSTDFIEPGDARRDGPADDGFLTWAELREMDASPEWRIEAHGTDHGHVVTGPTIVDRLTAANAGKLSTVQWAEMPGPKHDWYRRTDLPVPLGTPVQESAPALSTAAMGESEGQYRSRVADVLSHSQNTLTREIGRMPRIFCWPENKTSPAARRLARQAGFIATTGGTGRNTADEPDDILSRLHVGEDYAGFRSVALDTFALRAHLGAMEGNLWWGVPLLGFAVLKRASRIVARRSRRSAGTRGLEAVQ